MPHSSQLPIKRGPKHISLMIKTGPAPHDWECYQGELSEMRERIAFVVLDANIGDQCRGYGKLAIEDDRGLFSDERDVEFFWARTEMDHTCVGFLLRGKDFKNKTNKTPN